MALPDRSPPFLDKVGHGLAKVLGIKLQYRNLTGEDPLTRGESAYSVSTAETYVEQEPTAWEWLNEISPTPGTFVNWFISLFPFVRWIDRYNVQWLTGDLIAGSSSLLLERSE